MSLEVFNGPAVTLPEMLEARDRRASEQHRLLAGASEGSSLLSATLAIPGPVKTSPVLFRVFCELMDAAEVALGGTRVLARTDLGGPTGAERLMLVELDGAALKRAMVGVEESHPLGRLIDLDVVGVGPGGNLVPMQRTELGFPARTCLICGGPAKACARSRAHSVEEMQQRIATIIEEGGFEDCGKED